MIYAILIAAAAPLLYLYLVKRLNFFETHRPGLIFLALAWGAVAMGMSYLVDHPLVPIFGRPFVSTKIGPSVEEIFKALILLYLVRRADYTYFVDGAIYGFAVGMGFAVAENMLFLSRVDAETGLVLALIRGFSASVMHGASTALVGVAIGGFPLGRRIHPMVALVVGLAVAIAYHMAYDHVAFMNLAGHKGQIILTGLSFAGLLLIAATILWGLRRERRRLRRSLGMTPGFSKGEARLVQRIDDLDDLLAPVETRFGEAKREQVANVLLLGAQLGMKQALLRTTKDRELRGELSQQIAESKRELKRQRSEVGMYVMSYVRSIVPKTAWSLWARLGQTLTRMDIPKANIWSTLDANLLHVTPGEGLYAQIRVALDARSQEATRAIDAGEDLPEAVQRFVQWVKE